MTSKRNNTIITSFQDTERGIKYFKGLLKLCGYWTISYSDNFGVAKQGLIKYDIFKTPKDESYFHLLSSLRLTASLQEEFDLKRHDTITVRLVLTIRNEVFSIPESGFLYYDLDLDDNIYSQMRLLVNKKLKYVSFVKESHRRYMKKIRGEPTEHCKSNNTSYGISYLVFIILLAMAILTCANTSNISISNLLTRICGGK